MIRRRAGIGLVVVGGLLLVLWTALGTGAAAVAAGSTVGSTVEPAAGQGAAGRIDPATAGAVTGKVTLQGKPPANLPIRMNADPNCLKAIGGEARTHETYLTGPDNTLQNVFVYVKDGLGKFTYDAAKTPVVIDQKQCRYHPHVFGIRVGQPLDIVNSDATLHNIHANADENVEFNVGQPVQGMKTTKTFTVPEVMVPIRCDVHSWMNAYVGVLDHPFFTVTGAGGTFDIKNLPPGNYTFEAWHEKLGTTTQKVVVGPKQTKDITFVFAAT